MNAVSNALTTTEDECILIYQRVTSAAVRQTSVDANGDVWVGGYPNVPYPFNKLDGTTGAVLSTIYPSCAGHSYGGHGGLIDENGILWSTSFFDDRVVRVDPSSGSTGCITVGEPHGLNIDTNGNIWIAQFGLTSVDKLLPSGAHAPGFPKMLPSTLGFLRTLAVTPSDNNVWLGSSSEGPSGRYVVRLDNDGNVRKIIDIFPYGSDPRGVYVDNHGKVWVTNYSYNNALRIDPSAGGDGLGAVDLVVGLGTLSNPNPSPYNYAVGAPRGGLWRVVQDSQAAGTCWGKVSYNGSEPAGTHLRVDVRAAENHADLTNQKWKTIQNGVSFSGVVGHFIEVRVNFMLDPGSSGASPILYDLTVAPGAPCGVVYMGSGDDRIPLNNVTVEVVGTSPLIQVLTDSDGKYVLPDTPAVSGSHVVRGSVTYTEPASGQSRTIFNYPNRRPNEAHDFSSESPNRIPDIIYPWPVMMQPGFLGGDWTTFNAIRAYFEADPASTEKASLLLPGCLCFPIPNKIFGLVPDGFDSSALNINDHVSNAFVLMNWFSNHVAPLLTETWIAEEDLPSVPISIVGHSMGAIIARAYTVMGLNPRPVRIVSLDGVHGGTAFDVAGILPALGEWEMNGIVLPLGLTVPGWNDAFEDFSKNRWLLYSCINDFIVIPDESAWGDGRQYEWNQLVDPVFPLHPSGVVFTWMSGWKSSVFEDSHGSVHDDPSVIRNSLVFLESGIPPVGSNQSEHTALGTSVTHAVLHGSVSTPAGGSTGQSIAFDQNAAVSGQVLLTGTAAGYVVSDSSGPLTLENFVTENLEASTVFQTFTLSSPPIGTVGITLTAGSTSPATLQYALSFSNARSLVVESAPFTTTTNSSVQLRTWVRDLNGNIVIPSPGGSPTASVTVTLPDATTQTVQLFDDGAHGDGPAGDGVFGQSFAATALSGRYSLLGHVAVVVGSETVERTTRSFLIVNSNGATFGGAPTVGTPDANANGRFDALVLSQPVNFTKNGVFRVIATLVDGSGDVISHLQATYTNAQGAGTQALVLSAPGPEIVRHGVNGPWILRGRTLWDVGAGTLVCDTAGDFSTQAFLASAFDRPPFPKISQIVPNSGALTGEGTAVIQGSGFTDITSVLVGVNAATFTVRGEDSIEVTIPRYSTTLPHLYPGQHIQLPVDVKVVGPWGSATAWGAYTYKR